MDREALIEKMAVAIFNCTGGSRIHCKRIARSALSAIEAAGGYAPEGKSTLTAPDKLGCWSNSVARVVEFENGNLGVEIAEHVVIVGQGLGMHELAEEMTERWNALRTHKG